MRIKKVWVMFGLFALAGYGILSTAGRTMWSEQEYWLAVKDRFTRDSLCLPATRGRILSAEGKVMVATVPQYRLLMDFVVIDKDSVIRQKAQAWRDSVLAEQVDTIAAGLAEIFPDRTASWFRERLLTGRRRGSHAWRIYPRLVTYNEYRAVKQLPLLRETAYRGGFHVEKKMLRKKIYGSLAARTLGDVYADTEEPRSGLEWCYDSLLRGRNGWGHSTKVRDRTLGSTDQEPCHGHDIVTTIDTRMQDIAEKALLDKITAPDMVHSVETAVAIVMEVATGDVKALVSMTKPSPSDLTFHEIRNDAINALWEPGSTFKTASLMVAMEDGYITPETTVFCDYGICNMHGRPMKDHNWHRGGYGDLTATEILGQSSNIGVSKIIDKYYHDQPEKYVQGLYNLGVGQPLGLPMGSDPRVRMPKKDSRGRQYLNWSATTLAWMSIGYETQLTPMATLTFYNAIANGGRMVRPRFVTSERVGSETVREFPVEVLKEKICSDKTLKNIQTMLEKVVSEGLGKAAGNKKFRVSGKTGTAQVAENGSYAARKYMVSFCGYFPSTNPQYSCIVCIYKRGLPASGGGQCGPVFSQISQRIMNQGHGRPASAAADSTSVFQPTPTRAKTTKTTATGAPEVTGMGAKDAVHAMQTAGYSVTLRGTGRACRQEIDEKTKKATIWMSLNN